MIKMMTSLFFVATILFSVSAQADALKDPTQPPAVLDNNPDTNITEPITSTPTLQSIMLGAQYKAAIINGQKVFLGKKYEQATLIKLSENSAVLRNQDGTTQTLTMDYGTIKKINVTPVDAVLPTKSNVKRNTQ